MMIGGLTRIENTLLEEFRSKINFDPLSILKEKEKEQLSFDYFQFYTSVSSVYSSKIEGEEIDVDSYIKHKLLKVSYEPDYTKKADDLYSAYAFAAENPLGGENVLQAYEILSQNLLSAAQRGRIRSNPMFVINENDRIEYVACEPQFVKDEWNKLFEDIEKILAAELDALEVFYYAAYIHLGFLKIHPMQDGNGRTARLIEKWILREKLGKKAIAVELERNYYKNKQQYYDNIRKIGLDYIGLDYSKSLDFLLMTIKSLVSHK